MPLHKKLLIVSVCKDASRRAEVRPERSQRGQNVLRDDFWLGGPDPDSAAEPQIERSSSPLRFFGDSGEAYPLSGKIK